MTELPGQDSAGDRSPVRKRIGPKTARVLGILVLLPAVYALALCYTLLSGAYMDEGPWWLLVLGIAAAYGLAAPAVLRLLKGGAGGPQVPGAERTRTLPDRGPARAVAGGDGRHAERRLLEAIERHEEITPVRAALETDLTVAEAERMLGELAEGGHLEVRVRDGKLVYSF